MHRVCLLLHALSGRVTGLDPEVLITDPDLQPRLFALVDYAWRAYTVKTTVRDAFLIALDGVADELRYSLPGALAEFMQDKEMREFWSRLMACLVHLRKSDPPAGCDSKKTAPPSHAAEPVTAHHDAAALLSSPKRPSTGAGHRSSSQNPSAAPRASYGSSMTMARAPSPRVSDGALLPRALAGLRVSSGATHSPTRAPRGSGGAPQPRAVLAKPIAGMHALI